MPDLSTVYLGLHLRNPLVASASPMWRSLSALRQLEDAGAAAVVLPSLFEEQIDAESHDLDRYLTHGVYSYAEAPTYLPEPKEFRLAPDQYLEHVRKAKAAVGIPVIGSLNGVSSGGWIRYAEEIAAAGADALELNIYYVPTDPFLSSLEIEDMYVDLLRRVKERLTVPVAVKLSPFFTNLASIARRLDETGANGLVLFNRFYQPDIDLDALEVVPRATLSAPDAPDAFRLPLRWVAILYGRVRADLAASSGIHTPQEVLKAVMAGASVAMMTSAILRDGVERVSVLLEGLRRWLDEREYESIRQMRGSLSQRSVAYPAAFERAHYVRAISDYPFATP